MIESEVYIEKFKFAEIVRISREWREEKKGFQDEHTTEIIACKIEDKFYLIKIYCFSPTMGTNSYEIQSKNEISLEEYKTYFHEHNGIIDTEQSRLAIKELKLIHLEMDRIYPLCPKCSSKMTKRSGPRGEFLGCISFPGCKGTRNYLDSFKETFNDLQIKANKLSKMIIY